MQTKQSKQCFEFKTENCPIFRLTLRTDEYHKSKWLTSMVEKYQHSDAPIFISFGCEHVQIGDIMEVLNNCVSYVPIQPTKQIYRTLYRLFDFVWCKNESKIKRAKIPKKNTIFSATAQPPNFFIKKNYFFFKKKNKKKTKNFKNKIFFWSTRKKKFQKKKCSLQLSWSVYCSSSSIYIWSLASARPVKIIKRPKISGPQFTPVPNHRYVPRKRKLRSVKNDRATRLGAHPTTRLLHRTYVWFSAFCGGIRAIT